MRKDKSLLINSLSILGVGLTMISTIRDTTKACKLVDDKMTFNTKVKKTWKCYIPSGMIAASTILCIVYSDHVSQKEKASLLAALMATHNNYKTLRKSVDDACDDELKVKINNNVVMNKIPKELYLERTEEKIFYEEYSGEFFKSTIDNVLKAEYAFNKQLTIVGVASVNDFYSFLGLGKTSQGDHLGWSVYEGFYGLTTVNPWVDFTHDKMVSDDGLEYYFLGYNNQPEINYDMF